MINKRIEQTIAHYLENTPSLALKEAITYTLSNGGKQLRPALIYATGAIFDAPLANLDIPATAVELIHTYSLIHDDLPCMDNADLRRGKPTCHIVYNEGMAVLTGDALHTLSMQILSGHPAPLSAEKRVAMIKVLSEACGPFGMAAGQAMDITLMQHSQLTTDQLLEIYRLKTGALLSACVELGRLAGNDDSVVHQQALKTFGECIGLAFQIQDDILDIEVESEQLGKPQNIDVINNKMTYPAVLGLANAKSRVQALYSEGLQAIDYLGEKAQGLRELADKMLHRSK
ncbi:MAG: farnesyl diphosphate synthase [Gammaproteobacteria bacterium]